VVVAVPGAVVVERDEEGELQSRLPEQLDRLGGGEAQVCCPHLGQLSAGAKARQGERRVGPCRHQQVQVVGQVVDEEGDGVVHRHCVDGVVVVENEDPRRVPGARLRSGDGRVHVEPDTLEAGVEPLHQPGTPNDLRASRRREQLRGEDRGRHPSKTRSRGRARPRRKVPRDFGLTECQDRCSQ
jgi:hypothetical protein